MECGEQLLPKVKHPDLSLLEAWTERSGHFKPSPIHS